MKLNVTGEGNCSSDSHVRVVSSLLIGVVIFNVLTILVRLCIGVVLEPRTPVILKVKVDVISSSFVYRRSVLETTRTSLWFIVEVSGDFISGVCW